MAVTVLSCGYTVRRPQGAFGTVAHTSREPFRARGRRPVGHGEWQRTSATGGGERRRRREVGHQWHATQV